MNFSGDKDVLSKVNATITELIRSGEILATVDEEFGAKESLKLANLISQRVNDLSTDQKTINQKLIELNAIETGSKNSIGIDIYFKSKEEKQKAEKEEAELNKIISLFKELDKNESKEKNILERIKSFETARLAHQDILKRIESYLLIITEKSKLEADIKATVKLKSGSVRKLKESTIRHGETKTILDQLNEQIHVLNQSLKEISALNDANSKNKTQSDRLQKKILGINADIELLSARKAGLKLALQSYKRALELLAERKFDNISEQIFSEFDKQVRELRIDGQEISGLEKRIREVNADIKKQEQFNKALEDFITRGAAIVDSAQLSACPLCSLEYESYAVLSAIISSNKLLSDIMQRLLAQRSELESALKKLQDKIRDGKDKFHSDLKKKQVALLKTISEIDGSIEKNKLDKKNAEKELKVLSDTFKSYQKTLGNQIYETYLKSSQEQLKNLHAEATKHSATLKERAKMLQVVLTEQKQAESRLKAMQDSLAKMLKEKAYTEILAFLIHHFPKTDDPVKSLESGIVGLEKKISNENAGLKKLKQEITTLKKATRSYQLKATNTRLTEIAKTLKVLTATILEFERISSLLLGVKTASLSKSSLQQSVTANRKEATSKINKFEFLMSRYSLLAELRKNVEPFLTFQRTKAKEEQLVERKNILEITVQKYLDGERDKVIAHLDKQINSFFYEDLINDLYRRIDPHPDYKRIKFICDFDADKPRLNVCLYESSPEGSPIIPNLYFSTAQLNILSLSIFLAKALHTKDEKGRPINCIFIDDPIQSMDSINILSTIDLFRSIVQNQQRQIILSTHDQNFHNLLKKKMPPQYFKSKFLELETFGKVRQETN